MSGFYRDFLDTGSENPAEIMLCFTPESLPVLNSLASQFAVSDSYFSSIPTQTNCNRAFSLTGNSIGYWDELDDLWGMVDNYWEKGPWDLGDPYPFTGRTIFDVLSGKGMTDWKVFYSQTWPGLDGYEGGYCFTQDLLYPTMQSYDKSHFESIDSFCDRACQGTLPAFSFLEPTWYEESDDLGHPGSDYHPPDNLACGEQFLCKVYNALKSNPEQWKSTLLIVNFDEHGGTYDHVQPPATEAPWDNPRDGTNPPVNTEQSFDFKKLGVRVPLILASPLIQAGTVFRSKTGDPFDHTSVIATILNHFEIPNSEWQLGTRTVNAQTFEYVLDPANQRTSVEIAPPLLSCPASETVIAGDLQKMIMHRYIHYVARKRNYPKGKVKELSNRHLLPAKTMQEVNAAARHILDHLGQLPPEHPPKRSFFARLPHFLLKLLRKIVGK
jgi:phospholipase C